MKKIDFSQLEPDLVENVPQLSYDELRQNIQLYTGTKLADIIVMSRYTGLYKEFATDAMKELANRRANGDSFKFEEYIEDQFNNLPKVSIQIPNLASVLGSLKGFK